MIVHSGHHTGSLIWHDESCLLADEAPNPVVLVKPFTYTTQLHHLTVQATPPACRWASTQAFHPFEPEWHH